MNTVQATVYGATLLVHQLLGHVPKIPPKSTMNERLEISGDLRPVAGETVKLGILCVGNRGHEYQPGQNGIALTSIIDHMADHASLYNPMPLAMRLTTEDFTEAERSKLALRRKETHGGKDWYCYYGLRLDIDPDDVAIKVKKIALENGVEIETDFVPNTAQLIPDPTKLPNTGAVTTTDVKMVVRAILSLVLNEAQIAEYINVAKVLYGGDERYAIMSEFALCTAADRRVTVPSTSGNVTFNEAIGTQVYSFAADHKALYYNNQELTLDFDIGNQVPLLATASIPTLETIKG